MSSENPDRASTLEGVAAQSGWLPEAAPRAPSSRPLTDCELWDLRERHREGNGWKPCRRQCASDLIEEDGGCEREDFLRSGRWRGSILTARTPNGARLTYAVALDTEGATVVSRSWWPLTEVARRDARRWVVKWVDDVDRRAR